MPLGVGSVVAGYRIERALGTGGMGVVYLAKHPAHPRRDALKLLSAELSRDPGFRERFLREADIASMLFHPNIVSVYGRGETDAGQLWIAMQSRAPTLSERCVTGR
ncbi:serine/threonine protein kinase [Mycobacterium sp. OAE908]|uniref:protein kinase domain-containing protein n=1 Tax=Mycobacterium sp. OAE908 TaxID=2817899 RepID=UPI0034E2720F